MFFAALFAAYFTIRNVTNSQAAADRHRVAVADPRPTLLNIPFAILNTSVLVASSFTCQMGVFAAERGQVRRTGSLFNHAALGSAGVVHADLSHGRVLHRRPGLSSTPRCSTRA